MGWDGWTLCDSIAVLAKPPVSSWGRGTALLPTAAGHIPGAGTWRWEGEGRSTGHELKSISKQPLPTAPSCKGWMDRLAVAMVTPVPSVPPHQHGMHQPHALITSPVSTLNLPLGSDIPGPSGSCYSLPSQLTGTPGGGTLRNAFIPISAHPAVCPELPKQFLLLFSCLDPSDVLPAASLT